MICYTHIHHLWKVMPENSPNRDCLCKGGPREIAD